MTAISTLQSAGKTVSVNAVAQQMTPFLVNNYNNESLFVYKAEWIKRIATTMQLTNTVYVSLFFLNQSINALR
jgi:hypothetical protein